MTGSSLKSLLEDSSDIFLKTPSELFKDGTNMRLAKNQDKMNRAEDLFTGALASEYDLEEQRIKNKGDGSDSRLSAEVERDIIIKSQNNIFEQRAILNDPSSTAEEIAFTVTAIIDDYPAITVEEVILVFSRIKKGEYGKYYERFKTPEILEAIRLYESEDRAEMLEKHNQRYKLEEMSKSNEDVANNETALYYLKKWKENVLNAKMVDISKEVKKIQDHKQRLSFFEDNELQYKLVCDKVNEGFDLTNEEKVFMNKCGINL